ncbi:unnamed protein product [Aureobasidium uvarum]|uniref:Uncharacterized protein n=1 Tax=Aureobasidium uvarum TaxID=2773716 RepID=A0A9N8PQ30_9PEZI|nr:unnamed protein product [Aureobasidium uvarum]
MAAKQHSLDTKSSHSSFQDTVMGSKPELLRQEPDGMFDEEKGAVATAERPTIGDDGQRDAVATPPPAFDPRDNPDGGKDAWLVVLGAFCCMFCSFGWINCKSSSMFTLLPREHRAKDAPSEGTILFLEQRSN